MIERTVPRFDNSITLGHILTVITFIAVAVGGWYQIKSDHTLFSYRLDSQDKALGALTGIVHTLSDKSIVDATQNVKLDGIDQRTLRIEEYARETRARLHTVEDALNIPYKSKGK